MARTKGGKWTALLAKVPKISLIEPERADIISQVKQEIVQSDSDFNDLIDAEDELLVEQHLDIAHKALISAMRIIKRSPRGRKWASEYARGYAAARDLEEKVKDWRSAATVLVEAFESLMVNQLDAEGMTSLKLANGRPVTTFQEPYAQVVDRAAQLEWALEEPDLKNKLSLSWQTLNAHCKALLEQGLDMPPGVELWSKTTVRLGGEK